MLVNLVISYILCNFALNFVYPDEVIHHINFRYILSNETT